MNGILKNVMKYSKNKVYHNGSYYSKIRLPFKKNEKYLILWEPNHMTNIHGHNGKNCVFMKVRGDFSDKVYKNDVLVRENYTYLYETDRLTSVDIDFKSDLDIAEAIIKNKKK